MSRQHTRLLALDFRLTPQEPLLIKQGGIEKPPNSTHGDGQTAGQKARAGQPLDMEFVRTQRADGNGGWRWEPYLPGSSLKGVLRSRAEQLARARHASGQGACMVFDEQACSEPERWHDANGQRVRPDGGQAYDGACPVCRTFGHAFLAGRLRVPDAYLQSPDQLDSVARAWMGWERQSVVRMGGRDGVGIDRERGAARAEVKFDYEVWEGGPFHVRLELNDFELWQVGLVADVLADLTAGEIYLGAGGHRGLGRVKADQLAVRLFAFGANAVRYGRQRLNPAALAGLLGLRAAPAVAGDPSSTNQETAWAALLAGARPEPQAHPGLRAAWTLEVAAWDALARLALEAWQACLDSYQPPAGTVPELGAGTTPQSAPEETHV